MTARIHPSAIVETDRIGDGTNVWAFAHILEGAVIGQQCNICDHVFIENDVVIGDRVTIKCGVQVWDGITIEDDVFVGPNATFTNDPFPRSKRHLKEYPRTIVRKNASIGANATVLPGIEIGRNAMVGAGAVVTANVPPNAIVAGNPARIEGYCSPTGERVMPQTLVSGPPGARSLGIGDAQLIYLPVVADMRGTLSYAEIEDQVPFEIKRFFLVYDVPTKHVRGEHAHLTLHQLLISIRGSLHVLLDDGLHRSEVVLDSPQLALYVPPLVWTVQYKFDPQSVLLVLASDKYDPDDYIRNYEEFLHYVR